MLTATYYITRRQNETCTWRYTCANSMWTETPTRVEKPVPLAAVKRHIVQHFAGLGPQWSKRVYVDNRRVNRAQFLKGSSA